jgi:hypothetical protein
MGHGSKMAVFLKSGETPRERLWRMVFALDRAIFGPCVFIIFMDVHHSDHASRWNIPLTIGVSTRPLRAFAWLTLGETGGVQWDKYYYTRHTDIAASFPFI